MGCPALSESNSIWKAAGHTKFKSKCLAALEVLKLGKASIINKGSLLSIVFKNISPCKLKNWVISEALVLSAPLHQWGTQLTQAGSVLISAASSPPHHPLLSVLLSLQLSVTPSAKNCYLEKFHRNQKKGPGRGCAFKELFQTDSAELSAGNEMPSYYYLNGFQLQGCPPRLTRSFS